MYRMLRIFCATAWELEGERRAFYDVIGAFNETDAMKQGILYVPVSLTNTPDKRPHQYTIEENIRDSQHYILALDSEWGPKERNFERDYLLAQECRSNPGLPMSQVALLLRNEPGGAPSPFAPTLQAQGIPYIAFSGVEDFQQVVRCLLAEWLASDAGTGCTSAASA
jgi:hypothetical protein